MSEPNCRPDSLSHIGDRSRLTCNDVTADPVGAARLRGDFRMWLQRHFTLSAPVRGTVDLRVAYDSGTATLALTVADHGCWRRPITDPLRGRGIALMHALAEHAAIDTTPAGTQVRLDWSNLLTRDAEEGVE